MKMGDQISRMMNTAAERRKESGGGGLSAYGSVPQNLMQKARARPSIYHGEEQDKLTLLNVAETFSNNIEY